MKEGINNEVLEKIVRNESRHPFFEMQRRYAELDKKHDLLNKELEELDEELARQGDEIILSGDGHFQKAKNQILNERKIIIDQMFELLPKITDLEEKMKNEN